MTDSQVIGGEKTRMEFSSIPLRRRGIASTLM